jgi:hypothetical protein
MKNLTLKRILKKHQQNPQDEELHKIIENADIDEQEFHDVVKKGSEQPPFDKQK